LFFVFSYLHLALVSEKKIRFIFLRSESNLHFPIQFLEGADAGVLELFFPLAIFPPGKMAI
jgi:hypothetical protein